MEVSGLLKIRVRRGINLVVRDDVSRSSDPYVVVSNGPQKVKTKPVKNTVNPVWDEDLSSYIKDLSCPVILSVFDKDTFTSSDEMGNAEIDFKPLIECVRMGLSNLSDGTTIQRVQPTTENCLAKESCIVWSQGKITQDMILKLRNVETGEVEIQIEWCDIPRDIDLKSGMSSAS